MVKLNRIEIIGAGPAGLYSAILLKSAMPDARVRVSEQNPADATFGFGVVFSDQALDFLEADDSETHALITPLMERWRDISLVIKGERVVLDGIGFSALGRLDLLRVLQRRAREVGVEVCHGHVIDDIDELERYSDLVIGADGLNSRVRQSDEVSFSPVIDYCSNRFAWFGAACEFDTLTQTFIDTGHGVLNAHHYRYARGLSTFIVECDAASFDAHGFERMEEQASAEVCAQLFADTLEGAPLLVNQSFWRRFPRLWCRNWVAGRRVLLGDAAHSAHFSIGSGTRLALEDAIALVKALGEGDDLTSALDGFQQQRIPIARKIVDAAVASSRWYDDFRAQMFLPPYEFAYSYLNRSGRMDDARLRKLVPGFMRAYDEYRKGRS